MKPYLLLLLALLLPSIGAARAETIAITNVSIIDVSTGRTHPARTVVIRDTKIAAVGPGRRISIPANARVINGRGRFLIPGLWDMGSFVLDGRANGVPGAFELMIANGVTGTRDMGTAVAPGQIARLDRAIRAGEIVGPRLIWATKMLSRATESTGRGTSHFSVHSERDALAAVDRMAAEGAHYVRLHQTFPEMWLPAVVARARSRRMTVTGAIVASWRDAARAGLGGFDHFVDLYRSTARAPERDQFTRLYRDAAFQRRVAPSRDGFYRFFEPLRGLRDRPYYQATIAAMARAGTPVTTDMATMRPSQQAIGLDVEERRRFSTPSAQPRPPAPPGTSDGRAREGLWSDLRDLRDVGVPILAGTQAEGVYWELPGPTLIDELLILNRAGFTTREALAAATVTPARIIARLYPRVAAASAVAKGQPADIVMLDANPLSDIANVRRVYGVMANGRWFGPAERRALIEHAAGLAARRE
jgi:imidazolonepropionase-like amidohydrolase